MPGIELIRSFLQQATLQGSKSTVLSPLGWALATVIGGLIGVQWAKAPLWISGLLGAGVALLLLAYVVAYFIFVFRSPESLRSERYSLSKLAIEKSVKGDNLAGFAEMPEEPVPGSLPPSPPSLEDMR